MHPSSCLLACSRDRDDGRSARACKCSLLWALTTIDALSPPASHALLQQAWPGGLFLLDHVCAGETFVGKASA